MKADVLSYKSVININNTVRPFLACKFKYMYIK